MHTGFSQSSWDFSAMTLHSYWKTEVDKIILIYITSEKDLRKWFFYKTGDKIALVKLHPEKSDLLKFCAHTGGCNFCLLSRSDFGDGLISPQTEELLLSSWSKKYATVYRAKHGCALSDSIISSQSTSTSNDCWFLPHCTPLSQIAGWYTWRKKWYVHLN